jgi:methylated-DNA-protein-cysteine methyltransferase-like protein
MDPALYRSFFQEVYEIVALIPTGKVTTYGAIAHCLGSKQGARMVGWALNQLPHPSACPAHRVVNKQGLLTGKKHFQPGLAMEELLAAEGVLVKDNQIQDFEKLFWDPSKEIALPTLVL